MSSTIQFYHFDTAQKDDPTKDSFSCELTLSNPLRNVKKIYLKSCEIPVGYFNIRTPQYFEVTTAYYQQYDLFDPDTLGVYRYRPTWTNSYNTPSEDSDSNYSYTLPIIGENGQLTDPQIDMYKFSIGVVPGNYTINSLIKYINDALSRIFSIYSALGDFSTNTSASLSIVRVIDAGLFPVGYLQFTNTDEYTWILPTELSYKYLGFTSYKNNQQIKQTSAPGNNYIIQSLRLWNMYPDICIYMYLENVPQTNTHFKNN